MTTQQKFEAIYKDAENGDAEAQYKLGLAYLRGEGVERHDETGLEWLTKARDQGSVKAQDVLNSYAKAHAVYRLV